MKDKIHPDYKAVTFSCSCGNTMETMSTGDGGTLDICSNCHPFYTGKQKLVDSAGMIDKFKKKYAHVSYGGAKKTAKKK